LVLQQSDAGEASLENLGERTLFTHQVLDSEIPLTVALDRAAVWC